jgi:hypothetical protein
LTGLSQFLIQNIFCLFRIFNSTQIAKRLLNMSVRTGHSF